MFLPLPQCHFCNHANPFGAKFCNDCGSPLHLKPCSRCEAVNDQVAKNCYQCGTEFPVRSTAPDVATASPALATTALSATLSGMGFKRGHSPQPEPVADYVMTPPRSEVDNGTISVFSAAQRSADLIPLHDFGAGMGRRSPFRPALAIVLPVALFSTVGISAYYVYRHQVELSATLSSAQPDPAAPASITASPANESVKQLIDPDGVDGQRPTPSQSAAAFAPQSSVSTGDQAAPAQISSSQAAEVSRAPAAPTAVAEKARRRTMRAPASTVASAISEANPSTANGVAAAAAPLQSAPSDRRMNVAPDSARPSGCTQAMVALGLCSLTSGKEAN